MLLPFAISHRSGSRGNDSFAGFDGGEVESPPGYEPRAQQLQGSAPLVAIQPRAKSDDTADNIVGVEEQQPGAQLDGALGGVLSADGAVATGVGGDSELGQPSGEEEEDVEPQAWLNEDAIEHEITEPGTFAPVVAVGAACGACVTTVGLTFAIWTGAIVWDLLVATSWIAFGATFVAGGTAGCAIHMACRCLAGMQTSEPRRGDVRVEQPIYGEWYNEWCRSGITYLCIGLVDPAEQDDGAIPVGSSQLLFLRQIMM
jgi:hypothetical protein